MNKTLEKLFEILLSDKPSKLIKQNEKFVFQIIPQLEKCKGFNQNNPWHVLDVYEHILHVVDGVENNLTLRLSALFHDVGKPCVYTQDENGIGHFFNHWKISKEIFVDFANKYELDKNISKDVENLIFYHNLHITEKDSKIIENILSVFDEHGIKNLFAIKKSDLLSQAPDKHYLLNNYEKQEKNLLQLKKNKSKIRR